MTSTLRGAEGLRKKWDVIWRRAGFGQVFWTSNFYFFNKENWIWAMTRHHANNILLTRNLPFDSDVRQLNHPKWYHCIVCCLNWTTRRLVNLNVIWLCFLFFLFDFVHSHARCVCWSKVCLQLQDVQIKQVDCEMNTKNVTNYN